MAPAEYPVNARCCRLSVVASNKSPTHTSSSCKKKGGSICFRRALEKRFKSSLRSLLLPGLRIELISFVEASGLCAAAGLYYPHREWKNSCSEDLAEGPGEWPSFGPILAPPPGLGHVTHTEEGDPRVHHPNPGQEEGSYVKTLRVVLRIGRKDEWTLSDGIPVKLFQILKDDAAKVLHSICQQVWKTQQWPQDWKRSVFITIPKKGNAKECSNYRTIALISHASKLMLKILQARLQP